MIVLFFFSTPSIPSLFSSQAPKRLADQLGGKYRKGKKKGDEKLLWGQGSGAQHTSAKIDEADLYGENGNHDRKENGIFLQSRQQVQAVGAGVEAIEHRGEDEKGEKPFTAHTTNKVPLILVSEKFKNVKLNEGVLADIAPTLLEVMGVNKPAEMTGTSLIVK